MSEEQILNNIPKITIGVNVFIDFEYTDIEQETLEMSQSELIDFIEDRLFNELGIDSLGGAIGTASLPTVPITKGGTGLTSAGSANQALKMNSGGSALEFGTLPIAGGGTGATTLAGANIVASNANTTFTKALRGSTQTAGSQTGSVTLDFDTYQNFVLTATGNVTLANPSTESVGQSGIIVFIQDGTGSRTLSLGTDYETAGGAGLTISTAANAVDVIPYFVKASASIQLGAPQLAFA